MQGWKCRRCRDPFDFAQGRLFAKCAKDGAPLSGLVQRDQNPGPPASAESKDPYCGCSPRHPGRRAGGTGSFDCGTPSLREDIPSLRMTELGGAT
jgi:hypothetical protein